MRSSVVVVAILAAVAWAGGVSTFAYAKDDKEKKKQGSEMKTWCSKPVFAEAKASSGQPVCTFTATTKAEAAQAAKKYFIGFFAGAGISGTVTKAKCTKAKQ
jgi:xanthine dehydrogenase molybdopterin-binding subunit B